MAAREGLIALGKIVVVDYSPELLAFPALYEGERADKLLLLTSPTDGPVTLALPKNKNFRILQMRVYDGKVGEKVVAGGKKSQGPIYVSRSAEPWTMDAAAGQSVGVIVRFQPDFNIVNNGAGNKTQTLEINGRHWNTTQPKQPPWNVKVPVKGRFKGINLGVISFPENAEIEVIHPNGYDPKQKHVFYASIVMINSKEAATGTVRPISLPNGVTMQPFNVSIAKGEKKTVKVPIYMDRQAKDSLWRYPEVTRDLWLEVKFGQRSSQVGFNVTVYPSYHMWSFNGVDVGSCTVAGDFALYGSGEFRFFGLAENDDIFIARQVFFRGGFDGSDSHVNLFLHVDANDVAYNSYGFVRKEFKDFYTSYIHKLLPIKVTVKYP